MKKYALFWDLRWLIRFIGILRVFKINDCCKKDFDTELSKECP
jgi:hypothetical protein